MPGLLRAMQRSDLTAASVMAVVFAGLSLIVLAVFVEDEYSHEYDPSSDGGFDSDYVWYHHPITCLLVALGFLFFFGLPFGACCSTLWEASDRGATWHVVATVVTLLLLVACLCVAVFLVVVPFP